jgi:hypothetical protein
LECQALTKQFFSLAEAQRKTRKEREFEPQRHRDTEKRGNWGYLKKIESKFLLS